MKAKTAKHKLKLEQRIAANYDKPINARKRKWCAKQANAQKRKMQRITKGIK